ncbi:MAG: class I SAM-dependent rRNA methyltransferase [Bacteroidota bacterium]|nr:class I SAM-dependent rRNA methyltransferase [Bacteroidota bacterium]
MISIQLKPKKEESLQRFHPWVFSGAIQRIEGKPAEGDLVEVLDNNRNFLAIGHYQIGSIAVRVVSFENIPVDNDFWNRKIQQAYSLRKSLGLVVPHQNNTYRLVHGEGDSLPGLIVDVYDDTAVMQAHSVGMHEIRQALAEAIVKNVPEVRNVYYKSETTLPFNAPITPEDGYLIGKETADLSALENGLTFHVDWLRGQKTGFFVDQRENRALLERYSSGRSVLNMFCYTGGFSVYALRGGAGLVHSVDSSTKAVELTDKNVQANFPNDTRHKSFDEDAFKYLNSLHLRDQQYDLIILDPPAFAKHREAIRNALKGYKRLNAKAFEQIAPGGILFTFSCSQVITKEQFRLAVFSAAAESKRNVRILHQLSQPADHPINIYHPEGEYLKGLVLWVE